MKKRILIPRNRVNETKEDNMSLSEWYPVDKIETTLTFITTASEFNKWSREMWDMLTLSYERIGGLKTYKDYPDFCLSQHFAMIATDKNGKLRACAMYRSIYDSLKMVAIGCDQSFIGKLAVKQIIKDNIDNFHLHYWAEVGDRIEYYFKRLNGYSIPNIFAHEILGKSKDAIELVDNDPVHYRRSIGVHNDVLKKMIYGIKSEEMFNKVLEYVDDYDQFMRDVNNRLNEATEEITISLVKEIINHIYDAYEDDGFEDLVPSWNRLLHKSYERLKAEVDKTEDILTYTHYAEYLLRRMTPLKLNKLMFNVLK